MALFNINAGMDQLDQYIALLNWAIKGYVPINLIDTGEVTRKLQDIQRIAPLNYQMAISSTNPTEFFNLKSYVASDTEGVFKVMVPVPFYDSTRIMTLLRHQPAPLAYEGDLEVSLTSPQHKRGSVRREALRGLCFSCLKPGHTARYCRQRAKCETCASQHPTILHIPKPEETSKKELSAATSSHVDPIRIVVATVPVRLWLPGGKVCVTHAVLDNGSTSSFLSSELLQRLQGGGPKVSLPTKSLSITTVTSTQPLQVEVVQGLTVADWDLNNEVNVPSAYVVKKLPFSDDIPNSKAIENWPHLSNVPFHWVSGKVELLLGQNVPSAIITKEVVRAGDEAPYATRTDLGWALQGPLSPKFCELDNVVARCVKVDDVAQQLERLHLTNMQGVYDFSAKGPSQEDNVWKKIVESSLHTTRVGKKTQFVVQLPFKSNMREELKDNVKQAVRRLQMLQKRFQLDRKFEHDYREFMKKMLNSGFMEPVPDEEPQGPVSYVLHHGVYHPRKPNKIRVVFNCASKYKGVSLNDCLLSGPDLTNSLIGVLIRFRQEKVAFMADVDAMFYNVLVPAEQRDALRLLWFQTDAEGNPSGPRFDTYRLRVHLFGATSSTSVANFALRKAAQQAHQHGLVSSNVCQTVQDNFYVDDCLKSVPSEEEAVSMASGLIRACGYRGFNLSKFVSNSMRLMQHLEPSRLSKDLDDVDLNDQTVLQNVQERALGVSWNVSTDQFRLTVGEEEIEQRDFTRREVLSRLSALYDPLGLAAPVIIVARLVFQELTSTPKADWDELVMASSDIGRRWIAWRRELKHLQSVVMPRCFRTDVEAEGGSESKYWQLHTFCDASQVAYAAVVYLVNTQTKQSSFVIGKTRVAPLKVVTIPRLELTAAKLAVEMAALAEKELQFHIPSRIFWSDSETVLKYLNNQSARFHTFVANRVNTILASSQVEEWKYVHTTQNPADEATRGIPADQLAASRWIQGPAFLKEELPQEVPDTFDVQLSAEDPEVKTVQVVLTTAKEQTVFEQIMDKASSMRQVRRWIAVWLRVKEYLRKNSSHKGTFGWEELRKAELVAVKMAQEEAWPDLSRNEGPISVARNSPLYKLSPLTCDGVVYMKSRVRTQLPIIPKGRLATMLIEEGHRCQLHLGRQSTSTWLLQRYWIMGLNKEVRKVIKNCRSCRRHKAQPMTTEMASLPEFRLTPSSKPFETTGIDFFGPFMLRENNQEHMVKAYGVIFTCATSRAVHLEVAEDLTTSAFINTLRRFAARRGNVSRIVSDNGTNLEGAHSSLSKELQKIIDKHQNEEIKVALSKLRIEWIFNVPGASHHGGFWERLIRTIRQTLQITFQMAPPMTLNTFYTVLCECEAVLNDRPITTVSEDETDLSPLTPNHLLLGKGYCSVEN